VDLDDVAERAERLVFVFLMFVWFISRPFELDKEGSPTGDKEDPVGPSPVVPVP